MTIEEGLRIMQEAVETCNQRRWDVGQGTYDGALMAAKLEGTDISTYEERGRGLIEKAQGLGMIVRGRK